MGSLSFRTYGRGQCMSWKQKGHCLLYVPRLNPNHPQSPTRISYGSCPISVPTPLAPSQSSKSNSDPAQENRKEEEKKALIAASLCDNTQNRGLRNESLQPGTTPPPPSISPTQKSVIWTLGAVRFPQVFIPNTVCKKTKINLAKWQTL